MAMTGLQINKLLPGTNCKDCGSSTCLAFAMKMAAKKAEISLCPHASETAKATLGAAAEPPVRTLAAGPGGEVKLGGETVLFRHEKTFVSPTAVAVNLDAGDDPASLDRKLAQIRDYRLDRVGETFRVDMVAVTQGKAFESSEVTATPNTFSAIDDHNPVIPFVVDGCLRTGGNTGRLGAMAAGKGKEKCGRHSDSGSDLFHFS